MWGTWVGGGGLWIDDGGSWIGDVRSWVGDGSFWGSNLKDVGNGFFMGYIILLYFLYYFNMLNVKVEVLMLSVL